MADGCVCVCVHGCMYVFFNYVYGECMRELCMAHQRVMCLHAYVVVYEIVCMQRVSQRANLRFLVFNIFMRGFVCFVRVCICCIRVQKILWCCGIGAACVPLDSNAARGFLSAAVHHLWASGHTRSCVHVFVFDVCWMCAFCGMSYLGLLNVDGGQEDMTLYLVLSHTCMHACMCVFDWTARVDSVSCMCVDLLCRMHDGSVHANCVCMSV